MKIVVQRVLESSVSVEGEGTKYIGEGLVIFVGFCSNDSEDDIIWGIKKVLNMKILKDENGDTNLNILEKKADLLVISQFTLFASTKKGNKPSWHKAANSKLARTLYNQFINILQKTYLPQNIKTGFFGKNMQISVINDGPVTIILDSKNKI